MTRFTVLLHCGCIVFPATGSQLEQLTAATFDEAVAWGESETVVHARCVMHGITHSAAAIINGTGATIMPKRG